jgi:hypothetical protein
MDATRQRMLIVIAIAALVVFWAALHQQPTRKAAVSVTPDKSDSSGRSMPFEQCLQVIRRTASELAVAPVNIVETDILRMVRFCTVDGSVLVSCSRPDEKMVLTRSPYGCN